MMPSGFWISFAVLGIAVFFNGSKIRVGSHFIHLEKLFYLSADIAVVEILTTDTAEVSLKVVLPIQGFEDRTESVQVSIPPGYINPFTPGDSIVVFVNQQGEISDFAVWRDSLWECSSFRTMSCGIPMGLLEPFLGTIHPRGFSNAYLLEMQDRLDNRNAREGSSNSGEAKGLASGVE